MASHAPTAIKSALDAKAAADQAALAGADKPVARVNGTVLTERDLLREMYAMFPYARQHNGFPKALEPEIRRGALEMIIFEELTYQEAKRRKMTIPPARLAQAEADLRKEFRSQAEYDRFLKLEVNGSRQALRAKIRRSLLIEKFLKLEVTAKSRVSLAEAQAFYDKNPNQFEHGETFHIQSISILPPDATPDVLKEARQRAAAVVTRAKASKSYREFGLLAERMSDDDFRVKMGDHNPVGRDQLPPEIVNAALKMKPGEVSELIQLGNNYTVFRLVAHTPAGKTPFPEVKAKLQSDLQKAKTEKVRAALGERLRKDARIEKLQ